MIQVGLIGCGFVARLHLGAFARLGAAGTPAAVVAAADPAPGAAAAAGHDFGIPWVTEDYRELLGRDDVAAVHICTPNETHREIAVAAARAGKHVFLEKPIALTLEDADAIIEACEAAGVELMVGQSQRFDGIHWELRALVADGELGAPRHITTLTYDGYFWPGGWRAWQTDPRRSAGNLVHNGIHDLDLMTWVVGERPSLLIASGIRLASPELDTFDQYQIVLEFPNGATTLSCFGYSVVPARSHLRSVYVTGADGEARYESSSDGGWWETGGVDNEILPGGGTYDRQLDHWIGCLERGEPSIVRPQHARDALRLALAAERSAATGEPVDLTELADA